MDIMWLMKKISEIITLSRQDYMHIMFELRKRQLSKSINKKIKVSVSCT